MVATQVTDDERQEELADRLEAEIRPLPHREGRGGSPVSIAVLIPTIPERAALLQRAIASVTAQTLQPDEI